MSNKPILPNAYVDFEKRNLGLSPTTPSGIFGFVGYAEGGSATPNARVAVGTALHRPPPQRRRCRSRKCCLCPIPISTESVIGAVTPVRVGTSDGTVALAKDGTNKITNEFNFKVLITKSGLIGAAKFQVSTDGGENYDPSIVMTATYIIPGTNIKITFTDGTFGFDLGD